MFKIENYQIKESAYENPYLRVHLKGFLYYGYIISENHRFPWFHWLRSLIFSSSFWICSFIMSIRIFRGSESLTDDATRVATVLLYYTVAITNTNAFLQRKRVMKLIEVVHEDLQQIYAEIDEKEKFYLDRTLCYVHTITTILCVPTILATFYIYSDCLFRSFFLPETVFNMAEVRAREAQPILLFTLFPFGEVFDNIILSYLGPWYALLLGVTTIMSWHTFITCLIKYVTLKLEILYKRMKEMDVSRLKDSSRFYESEKLELNRRQLKLCGIFVEEQLKIRRFVKELEALIRIPLFVDFLIYSVVMCFLFYALIDYTPNGMDYYFVVVYLFAILSILWLYHWHATLISLEYDRLSHAIYSCDWYNYSVSVQKTLLLLMMEAMRPIKMKAVLVELNLNTFIEIIRGAYSFFNILRSRNMAAGPDL